MSTRPAGTVAVIAKEPLPGLVKTRLCPPFSPRAAAELATAALNDTLRVTSRVPAGRRVLVLDGAPGGWLPPGIEVVPQGRGGLARRLARAFEELGGPTVLIGMDTPQLDSRILSAALAAITDGDADAALGMATDGGYWLIGMRRFDPRVFTGVPMSTGATGRIQLTRMRALDWRVALLPALRDVDSAADAFAVARAAPQTVFARALAQIAEHGAVA